MKKSNYDYVRERAELAGLALSHEDVIAIQKKWEDTPSCNLDDLIVAVRRLRELPRETIITTPAP